MFATIPTANMHITHRCVCAGATYVRWRMKSRSRKGVQTSSIELEINFISFERRPACEQQLSFEFPSPSHGERKRDRAREREEQK